MEAMVAKQADGPELIVAGFGDGTIKVWDAGAPNLIQT